MIYKGYVLIHDGHCASGWLDGNTYQSTIEVCYQNCKNNKQCFYFAYDDPVDGTAGSTNCALYGNAGCTDDNNYPTYNAYEMRGKYIFTNLSVSMCVNIGSFLIS